MGEKFKKKYPDIRCIDVDLNELNTTDGFKKIIARFELEKCFNESKHVDVIGKPLNLKLDNN